MVLDEAAIELDVQQRLVLVCWCVLVACGPRGLAVAGYQVPHLHARRCVGAVVSAIMPQGSTKGPEGGLGQGGGAEETQRKEETRQQQVMNRPGGTGLGAG